VHLNPADLLHGVTIDGNEKPHIADRSRMNGTGLPVLQPSIVTAAASDRKRSLL
jgi:hypothetical protein